MVSVAGNLSINEPITTQGDIMLTAVGAGNRLTNTSTVTSTNSPVTLRADQMVLGGGTINAGLGRVILMPDTSGRGINLGSDADSSSGDLALSDAEIDKIITTGTLQIGVPDTGEIRITAPINSERVTTMTLMNGGAISQRASLTEENLRIQTAGPVSLTDPANQIGQIAVRTTGPNNAITVVNGGNLTVGSADIATGISTLNGASSVTLTVLDGKTLTNNGAILGSEVILRADQMALAGGTINAGAGRVTLEPNAVSRPIHFEMPDSLGRLSLSDAELDTITTTGTLQIGNNTVGAISINVPIDTQNVSTLTLIAGQDGISQTAPIIEENLRIESAGPVVLTAQNDVGALAANVMNDGAFTFTDIESLRFDRVDGVTGIKTRSGMVHLASRIDLD
jgi:hypothetical protein